MKCGQCLILIDYTYHEDNACKWIDGKDYLFTVLFSIKYGVLLYVCAYFKLQTITTDHKSLQQLIHHLYEFNLLCKI